ncbi:CtsR family transcriptional regulator [Schnuerera sp. xch1]|uniref:CtsR family transcriptional regulator n=1 Tax=Schnuerera sp. xch1 TaxID=2874283 RepID=UPI001CBCFFA1|nr:CtsR family transcriptional regulator [Schnuerera sp. xch1]MBZ2175199.1 CtsR family transcriptional regulator [Schnuerera sp. xch1]
MPRISNVIERFIKEMLEEAENGIVEIGRNEMAQRFGCAPSQINYVLTTRFTPYKGYYIESRRGGGGYIKIMKVKIEGDPHIENLIRNVVGDSITKNKAYHIIETLREEKAITEREESIMKASIEDTALSAITKNRNRVRADILKNMFLILLM